MRRRWADVRDPHRRRAALLCGGSVRHENGNRHITKHVAGDATEDQFQRSGMAVGPHHNKVRPGPVSPRAQNVAHLRVLGICNFNLHRDAVAREIEGNIGAGLLAVRRYGPLLGIDDQNSHRFCLTQYWQRVAHGPSRLSSRVPCDQDSAADPL